MQPGPGGHGESVYQLRARVRCADEWSSSCVWAQCRPVLIRKKPCAAAPVQYTSRCSTLFLPSLPFRPGAAPTGLLISIPR